jgi:hypothetical protein
VQDPDGRHVDAAASGSTSSDPVEDLARLPPDLRERVARSTCRPRVGPPATSDAHRRTSGRLLSPRVSGLCAKCFREETGHVIS